MSLKRKSLKAICVALAVTVIAPMSMTPAVAMAEETTATETSETNTVTDGETEDQDVSISVASTTKIKSGKSKKIKVTAQNVDKDDIVWKSSNKKVATVTKSGKVKAKKKGTVTITATVKGTDIKDTCKVTVERYKTIKVKATAYCNCSKCCGSYAGGPTATGTKPKQGRTIAVDPDVIKLGSKVEIDGKMYVAEDTGGAIKGNRIDIYFSKHSKLSKFGVQYKTIKVYY